VGIELSEFAESPPGLPSESVRERGFRRVGVVRLAEGRALGAICYRFTHLDGSNNVDLVDRLIPADRLRLALM